MLMSRRTAYAVLIAIVTLITYLPALRAGFIWDDDDYVTRNRTLLSRQGLRDIWLRPRATPQYYPLVHTTFWIERRVWGLRPSGYHLDNILLHAAAAILLWLVAERLNIPGAPLAGVLFALHPVNVESVAWITERKNVLGLVFALLTVLAFLRFRRIDSDQPPDWRSYWQVIVLFILAIFSKTVTCVLPAILLVLIWWKRGRISRADLLALAPLFVIGITAGLLTAYLEIHRVGAAGAQWSLPLAGRLILAGRAACFYLYKDIWPRPLIFIYPRWTIDPANWISYLFPLGIVALAAALWKLRNRIGRAPLAVLLCYLITLFPAMGFFNVYPMRYSYVADHFQYFALVPLIVGAAALLATMLSRRTAIVATVLLGAACAVLSFHHATHFRDLRTLWTDTLAKNPRAWMAAHNLGNLLADQGKFDEAIRLYEQALAIVPNEAPIINQLAVAQLGKGERMQALATFDRALAAQPEYGPALINLAGDAMTQGDFRAAEDYARRAVKSAPEGSMGYVRLGRTFRAGPARRGHRDAAQGGRTRSAIPGGSHLPGGRAGGNGPSGRSNRAVPGGIAGSTRRNRFKTTAHRHPARRRSRRRGGGGRDSPLTISGTGL